MKETILTLVQGHISYLYTYDLYGPVRNVFDACISIRWASRRGLGPGNPKFLGPVKWHRADRREPFRAQPPTPPMRSSNITALLHPIPNLIRNQEETVRYMKERSGTQTIFCFLKTIFFHKLTCRRPHPPHYPAPSRPPRLHLFNINIHANQCAGSMTFWCGSRYGSADPCL
jgi:hypothetical protein